MQSRSSFKEQEVLYIDMFQQAWIMPTYHTVVLFFNVMYIEHRMYWSNFCSQSKQLYL